MEGLKIMFYMFVLIPICISFIIAIIYYIIVLYVSLKKYGFKKTVIQFFNAIKKNLGFY